MAGLSSPIGCGLCSTSITAPATLPTPTRPLSFEAVPNCLTCTPATFYWSYIGPPETFTLIISEPYPFQIYPLSDVTQVRRDVTSFLIAEGLDATDLTSSWPAVNVPSGWYVLQAIGTGFSATSRQFFVGVGTDTSCLDMLAPPAPSFGPPTPISTLATSEIFISTSTAPAGITPFPSAIPLSSSSPTIDMRQTDGIIGGLVGAAVLLAAAFGIYRLLRQRRTPPLRLVAFLNSCRRRRREDVRWGFGIASRPSSPVHEDLEKDAFGFDRPQLGAVRTACGRPRSTASMSNASDMVELSAASESVMYPAVESQRAIALAALNANSASSSLRSQSPSPSPSADLSILTVTPRPRYVRTPEALDLSASASTSTRSPLTLSSFVSGQLATPASAAPSSATSRMYRVRDSAWSEWPMPESEPGAAGTDSVDGRTSVGDGEAEVVQAQ